MPASTAIGFRSRPVHPDFAVNTQISKSLRAARSYQGQHIPLTDAFVSASVAVGSFTPYSRIALQPADVIVSATVTVATNTGATTFDVEINGTLQGANLGGTWSLVPAVISIKPYCVPVSGPPSTTSQSMTYVRLKNVSGATSALEFQTVIVVLR
jgi:hypothetical protein